MKLIRVFMTQVEKNTGTRTKKSVGETAFGDFKSQRLVYVVRYFAAHCRPSTLHVRRTLTTKAALLPIPMAQIIPILISAGLGLWLGLRLGLGLGFRVTQ